MKLKIEKNEKTDAFRETQITEMRILCDNTRLTFWVEGRMPKKMRRSICLIIYRQIKPILKLRHAAIYHQDSSGDTRFRESGRTTGLEQAPEARTPDQRRGLQIRLERLKREWTLNDLSQRTGISASHLSKIEHGKHPPYSSTLRKIEDAFQVHLPLSPSEKETRS